MSNKSGPEHVVVDGSNIATEGRSLPSLAQLQDAVMAFMAKYPDTAITVVVDATFGHRIDKSEVKDYDEGIANNELVSPPAGAVGRGDAFVLSIADTANATVLSNDSFQEFHGEYGWLFDEGRLIGGKPVPHVGWVFVDRVPVRGPVSRKATASKGSSKRGGRSRGGRKASKAASEPMPVPKSPPPSGQSEAKQSDDTSQTSDAPADNDAEKRPAPKRGEPVNDVLPFLQFVEHHPIGTSINGTVDAYSSHGAYISIGDDGVRGYIPLRLMSDPPPRSARKQMKIGESVTAVVVSFVPERRSIDCALPDMAAIAVSDADVDRPDEVEAEVKEAVEAETTDVPDAPTAEEAGDGATVDQPPAKKPSRRRGAAKKSAAQKTAATKTAARKPASKKSATKKTTPKRSAAKQAAATKTASTTDATAATKKSPAKKAAAKKTATKKAAAKKAATKKAATKKTATKKAATKKTATKKAATKKAATKKAAAKKSATKKSAAKTAAAKKSTAKRTPQSASGEQRSDSSEPATGGSGAGATTS